MFLNQLDIARKYLKIVPGNIYNVEKENEPSKHRKGK